MNKTKNLRHLTQRITSCYIHKMATQCRDHRLCDVISPHVALLTFKLRNTSTPSYLRLLIQDGEHGRNLRSTTTALCQPFTTTTLAKRAFRCSAPAVWNSLPKTVLSSDSVAVFKSRLSLLSLLINTLPMAPVPLKLRPYGAIQICLLLLLLLLCCQTSSIRAMKRTPNTDLIYGKIVHCLMYQLMPEKGTSFTTAF